MDVVIVVLKVAGVLLAIPAAYFLVMGIYGLWSMAYWHLYYWRRRERVRDVAEFFEFADKMVAQPRAEARARLRKEQEELWEELGITPGSSSTQRSIASVAGEGHLKNIELRVEKLDLDKLPPHLREKVERLQRGEDVGEVLGDDATE